MKTFEKLRLVKEKVRQLDSIILVSKTKYKMIAIDLSKQQALDYDAIAI